MAPRRAQLNRYSGLRYKAMMARERGAKAVLVVTGPNSPGAGELLALTDDGSHSGSGIVAASVSTKVADALLAASGKNLKDLQTGLDTENPHAEGSFFLPKVRVKISVGVEHLKNTDRNVVGVLPPAGGSAEYVLVGAHYDHLGHGGKGSSMAHAGEEGQIHPGADDNASGTSVVMEIAGALAAPAGARTEPEKPRRGVIFALWSGEEIGLTARRWPFARIRPYPWTTALKSSGRNHTVCCAALSSSRAAGSPRRFLLHVCNIKPEFIGRPYPGGAVIIHLVVAQSTSDRRPHRADACARCRYAITLNGYRPAVAEHRVRSHGAPIGDSAVPVPLSSSIQSLMWSGTLVFAIGYDNMDHLAQRPLLFQTTNGIACTVR